MFILLIEKILNLALHVYCLFFTTFTGIA